MWLSATLAATGQRLTTVNSGFVCLCSFLTERHTPSKRAIHRDLGSPVYCLWRLAVLWIWTLYLPATHSGLHVLKYILIAPVCVDPRKGLHFLAWRRDQMSQWEASNLNTKERLQNKWFLTTVLNSDFQLSEWLKNKYLLSKLPLPGLGILPWQLSIRVHTLEVCLWGARWDLSSHVNYSPVATRDTAVGINVWRLASDPGQWTYFPEHPPSPWLPVSSGLYQRPVPCYRVTWPSRRCHYANFL